MANRAVADTGPLVAVVRTREKAHEQCAAALKTLRAPLLTCWPVLTEAAWLLRDEPGGMKAMRLGEWPGRLARPGGVSRKKASGRSRHETNLAAPHEPLVASRPGRASRPGHPRSRPGLTSPRKSEQSSSTSCSTRPKEPPPPSSRTSRPSSPRSPLRDCRPKAQPPRPGNSGQEEAAPQVAHPRQERPLMQAAQDLAEPVVGGGEFLALSL